MRSNFVHKLPFDQDIDAGWQPDLKLCESTFPSTFISDADAKTVRRSSRAPLFFPHIEKSGGELGRVIAGLTDRLRVQLADLGRSAQHQELLAWHDTRRVDHQVLKLRLDLGDSTGRLKLLLATVYRFDRRMVFSPSLPHVWFDLLPGESLEERATDFYQSYFRRIRKDIPDHPIEPYSIAGKAWLDQVTIDVMAGREAVKPVDPLRAFLGGSDVSDGASELRKTGRCFNWIDINELAEPIGVEDDVNRLMKLLEVGDRRGVVLVGPSGSGKTARIEGVARKRRERDSSSARGLMWQLSPARLISGMSYLGQWQRASAGNYQARASVRSCALLRRLFGAL